MNRAIFFIAVVALSLLGQGCVGIRVQGTKERTFEPVIVSEKPSLYGVIDPAVFFGKQGTEDPAPAWLKEHWGKPSKVKRVTGPGQGELWTYNFDRAWCGAVPMIIIPIPLILPVGRERVVFHIRGGAFEKVDVVRSGGYEAIASFIGPHGPFVLNEPFPENF